MKKETTSPEKFKYSFKEKFETVWSTMKNISKTNKIASSLIKGLAGDPTFVKGKNSYEVDAEFYFSYRVSSVFNMKTLEVEKKKDSAFIKWECKIKPDGDIYELSYNIKSRNGGLNCDIELVINYKTDRFWKEGELEAMRQENFYLFTYIEKCIIQQKIIKIQEENIKISADFNTICDFILAFKCFHKHIPDCCDAIDYEGDILDIGSKVTLEWKVKQKMKVFLIVTKNERKEDYFSLVFESVGSTVPLPNQLVEWRVTKSSEGEYLVKFFHVYKDKVKKEALDAISKCKKGILNKFKMKMEFISEK
jgi:hypothetical protein